MDLADVYRRFLKNAGMIIGSRVIFGLLNLASSAVAVRSVGLQDFGTVVLLQAYTRLFTEIVKFESWQAVLTYGARLFDDDRRGLRQLLGLTLSLDLLSMLVGIACGIAFIPLAGRVLEWPDAVTTFAPAYLLAIPFITQATPSGVLRLFDRVDILVYQHAANALVRFGGVVVSWELDGGILGLVLAWFLGSVFGGLIPIVVSMMLLGREALLPIFRLNLFRVANEFPRIWRFLAFANVSSSISFVYSSGAAMFTGATLGPSAAATLQIAQQFSHSLRRPVRLLGPVIFPEFARLAAKGDWLTFRKLLARQLMATAAVVGGLGLVLFALLEPLLAAVYTRTILDEIWLFRILILSAALSMITFAFEPAMLSANKPGTLLIIRAIPALLFIATVVPAVDSQGLIAVGYGSLVVQVSHLLLSVILGSRLMNKRLRRQAQSASVIE